MQEASYSENETAATGKKNEFPEWSPPEVEMQRKARAAVGAIRTFPDLEKRLIETLGFGPAAIMMHQLVGYWFRKPKMQGRWEAFKTNAEWKAERGLARKQVEKGRNVLRARGLLKERHGRGKKLYFRVDWVQLARALNLEFRMLYVGDVLECSPPDGGLSASQEAGIPHGNGVHADVRTSPEEKVGGTFSHQENTQEKSPYRGTAEPAVAEPAPAPRERRKSKKTPPEGIAALRKAKRHYIRSLWELALEWDFTQDRRPPISVFLTLGTSDKERLSIWKDMRRIAREGVAAKQDVPLDDPQVRS